MNYAPEYLGVDQTVPAPVFVRQFAPTDIQLVAVAMRNVLLSYHPSWGPLSLDYWRMIGFDDGAILKFLSRYIMTARAWKEELAPENWSKFADQLQGTYDYSDADVSDYLRAMLDVKAQGLSKPSIYRPFEYSPTTPVQDIAAAAAPAAKAAAAGVSGLLLAALALYLGVTVLAPKLLMKRTT